MNLQEKNNYKIIKYFGLFFLFLALTILFGVWANEMHNNIIAIKINDKIVPSEYKSIYIALIFADISVIFLTIYQITKIIFCLQFNNTSSYIDKNNSNNINNSKNNIEDIKNKNYNNEYYDISGNKENEDLENIS